GFLLLLAALVYVEASKPQPVNWFPSYNKEDKIPLGTFVLFNLIEESFSEKISEKDAPPFEVLSDSTLAGTYFFSNDYLNFDEIELNSLMHWAEKGNTVFMSANYFGEKLLDTLNLETNTAVNIKKIGTQPLLKLVHKKFASQQPFHIKKDL